MSGLDRLKQRLNFYGGDQESRMQRDKLISLKRSLLYSYQAATISFADGRAFKALINPDKLKPLYDNKIISIPYNAKNLASLDKNEVPTNISTGQIFRWEETGTDWIVYLRYLEEDSYFRADIRRCKHEVDVNGKKYKAYVRGPIETTTQWNQKGGVVWNDMNYSLVMMLTKDKNTLNFFHRFQKVKLNGKRWEVQVVNEYSSDDVIEVYLDEYFSNSMEDEQQKPTEVVPDEGSPHIIGDSIVSPYDNKAYKIYGAVGGTWSVDSNKVQITKQDEFNVDVTIVTGKSGKFILTYKEPDGHSIELPIVIKSL